MGFSKSGFWLDFIISNVFSNLNDAVIAVSARDSISPSYAQTFQVLGVGKHAYQLMCSDKCSFFQVHFTMSLLLHYHANSYTVQYYSFLFWIPTQILSQSKIQQNKLRNKILFASFGSENHTTIAHSQCTLLSWLPEIL